ncbi:glycosyl hydrolase family 65 protein [Nocardia sp. NPDC046763]|uniref:glycosyl hydrolase family 65 protein n=1 Tax=Nocardia sp. NPDC046763 TaxID=3155256 RepID=UPI0034019AB0
MGGFGGARDQDGDLGFVPRLPERLHRLCIRILWHGSRIRVDITAESTTYRLESGDSITLTHHGRRITLTDRPITLPNLSAAAE